MPTFRALDGTASSIESTKNADGTVTYKATITDLDLQWDGFDCTVVAQFTVEAPPGMPTPGHGNVFRFADQGGYEVRVSGGDFDGESVQSESPTP